MNAGEKARFEPFDFSVSIFEDIHNPSIDLPIRRPISASRDSTTHRCAAMEVSRTRVTRCVTNLAYRHQTGISLTLFIVVELSWDRQFEGPAADVLLHTISTYLTKPPSGPRPPSSYANCAPLVNSSGTRKSRMVDELSKRVITVPMCLRGYGTKGSAIETLYVVNYLAYVLQSCRIPSSR